MSNRTGIMMLAFQLESDPDRCAEVQKHYAALVGACNTSIDEKGEQDALAMAEAVALLLAQQLGNTDPMHMRGMLNYISHRAEMHAPAFRKSGQAAAWKIVPDDD